MEDEFIKIFREICERNVHYNSGRVAKIVEKSKEYIQSHYADPDLNGAMIAEHFQVNYSYMSSVFKKQTSEGMLTYITKVRIDKAVELLKTTNFTIKEIAISTGYTNVRTFSRAFIKIMGISPGSFRDKNV